MLCRPAKCFLLLFFKPLELLDQVKALLPLRVFFVFGGKGSKNFACMQIKMKNAIKMRRYTHTRLYARERRIWQKRAFICD